MAINPTITLTVSMVDRSGEPTSFSIPTSEANVVAGFSDVLWDPMQTALAALIDGQIQRWSGTFTTRVSNVTPASAGQREQKFLVSYQDDVTLAKYSFELPCRKVSLDPPLNTDEYVLTAAPFAAFVAALEGYALSPDGNAITVTSIRLMGKNT